MNMLVRRRLGQALVALALLCAQPPALAQAAPGAPPTIREIAYEGNARTQVVVMARELVVAPGAPADPAAIERSRQAIQDLGLFRSVSARTEPVDGGVRVVFTVRERWYLLPVPRVSYDSDGRFTYGGQVAWSNVQGLNDTLKLNFVRGDSSDPQRGVEQTYSMGYVAPFAFDSPWTVDLSGSFRRSPVTDPSAYSERFATLQTLATRRIEAGVPASQGWQGGGGLLWQSEATSGESAPPGYGQATSLVGLLSYRNLHNRVYSDEGWLWNLRGEWAIRGLASDYGYEQITTRLRRAFAVPGDPHQNLNFIADLALRFDGPPQTQAFSLGGRSGLRAYAPHVFEGDAEYRVAAEYLHPLGVDWLRGLVVLEAGNVYEEPEHPQLGRIRTSLGIGVRARVVWLVNFEFEAGVAVPLDRMGAPRFFGGRS